jgi:hypothetical protein
MPDAAIERAMGRRSRDRDGGPRGHRPDAGGLVVQGAAASLAVEVIGWLVAKGTVGGRIWWNGLATFALILILLIGHLAQMAAWVAMFVGAGEFQTFGVAFYHSAVNYTTLGYGDIVMSHRRRLLGPLEAATGTLAFGWSTAAIVTVVIRLVRFRHHLGVGDATTPCFPVRRSRYNRIDMVGDTPEREGTDDDHVSCGVSRNESSSSVAVLARRWYQERAQDVDMTSPADRDRQPVEWLRLRAHSTSTSAQPRMPAKILTFMVAPPGRPDVEEK